MRVGETYTEDAAVTLSIYETDTISMSDLHMYLKRNGPVVGARI